MFEFRTKGIIRKKVLFKSEEFEGFFQNICSEVEEIKGGPNNGLSYYRVPRFSEIDENIIFVGGTEKDPSISYFLNWGKGLHPPIEGNIDISFVTLVGTSEGVEFVLPKGCRKNLRKMPQAIEAFYEDYISPWEREAVDRIFYLKVTRKLGKVTVYFRSEAFEKFFRGLGLETKQGDGPYAGMSHYVIPKYGQFEEEELFTNEDCKDDTYTIHHWGSPYLSLPWGLNVSFVTSVGVSEGVVYPVKGDNSAVSKQYLGWIFPDIVNAIRKFYCRHILNLEDDYVLEESGMSEK